jgi:hypothetical protein
MEPMTIKPPPKIVGHDLRIAEKNRAEDDSRRRPELVDGRHPRHRGEPRR